MKDVRLDKCPKSRESGVAPALIAFYFECEAKIPNAYFSALRRIPVQLAAVARLAALGVRSPASVTTSNVPEAARTPREI